MLKGPNQNLLINRICPNPLMFLQGVTVEAKNGRLKGALKDNKCEQTFITVAYSLGTM